MRQSAGKRVEMFGRWRRIAALGASDQYRQAGRFAFADQIGRQFRRRQAEWQQDFYMTHAAIVWQDGVLISGSLQSRCFSSSLIRHLAMSIIKNLPFEWLVGLRYTRAGKRSGRNSFISFISLISMAGIALGVAALIVVLSVMNGFQKDVRARILGVASHVQIGSTTNRLTGWEKVAQTALEDKRVQAAAPFVQAQ